MLERAGEGRRDRRYVYSGDSRTAGIPTRTNRRAIRRKVSTFHLLMAIFSAGIIIVLYIHNIITVNRLAKEVNQLQQSLASLESSRATLQAEVNRKATLDRLGSVATGELGLRYPVDQPIPFSVDEDLIEELKEVERGR